MIQLLALVPVGWPRGSTYDASTVAHRG